MNDQSRKVETMTTVELVAMVAIEVNRLARQHRPQSSRPTCRQIASDALYVIVNERTGQTTGKRYDSVRDAYDALMTMDISGQGRYCKVERVRSE